MVRNIWPVPLEGLRGEDLGSPRGVEGLGELSAQVDTFQQIFLVDGGIRGWHSAGDRVAPTQMNGEMGMGRRSPKVRENSQPPEGVNGPFCSCWCATSLVSNSNLQFSPHLEAHLTPNQDRKRGTWKKLHQKEFFSEVKCQLCPPEAANSPNGREGPKLYVHSRDYRLHRSSLGTNSKQVFAVHQA